MAAFLFVSPHAWAGALSADSALCRALVKHVTGSDVAYTPGVDVYGRSVAPADVQGAPQIRLPDRIEMPLTLDLAKTLGLDVSAFPYDRLGTGSEARLGTLAIEGDRVTFDGQPLSDDQQDRLAVLCLQPG